MVASSHMWLFNTWNMGSATEKPDFKSDFILINLNLSSQM